MYVTYLWLFIIIIIIIIMVIHETNLVSVLYYFKFTDLCLRLLLCSDSI